MDQDLTDDTQAGKLAIAKNCLQSAKEAIKATLSSSNGIDRMPVG